MTRKLPQYCGNTGLSSRGAVGDHMACAASVCVRRRLNKIAHFKGDSLENNYLGWE